MLTVPGRFGDDVDAGTLKGSRTPRDLAAAGEARLRQRDSGPALGRQLEQQLGQRLWPVHRLDREVSGLVLFARTAQAHRLAGGAFEGRRVDKQYVALTEGATLIPACPASFTWESLLVRGKKRAFEAPHGKPSLTRAEALAHVPVDRWLAPDSPVPSPPQILRWRLLPETGRPHQLRVHLARAGFAVVGDALYGAKTKFVQPGAIALRSVRLEFNEADARALGIPGPLELPGFYTPDGAPVA